MEDAMTCPLCRGKHPLGTTWCSTMFAEITQPVPLSGTESLAPAELLPVEPAESAAADESPEAVCGRCGDIGPVGEACRQCGSVISGSRPVGAAGQTAMVLPSGVRVPLPKGLEIAVGRGSELAELRSALAAFDAVSRQHFLLIVDPARARVAVRDPGSTNGTWVGDDPRRVQPGEVRYADLPVRIRLGQETIILIEGGAS